MANWQAEVLTEWVTDANGNRPRITDDYQLQSAVDATGQPAKNIVPAPNQCIWLIVCDEATLDAIESDSNYTVLWCEEVVPDAI